MPRPPSSPVVFVAVLTLLGTLAGCKKANTPEAAEYSAACEGPPLRNMKPNPPPTIGAALLFATIAFHAAQAQTQPARMVARDELRACMNSESELATRRQAVDARSRQNRDEATAIRAESAQLKAEHEKLELDNAPMEKFQRKAKVHNARVQAAQAVTVSFNTELDALNKLVAGYNQKCGGISFLAEDKEAILKERAAPKN